MARLSPDQVVADIVASSGISTRNIPISWKIVDAVPGPAIEIRILTREIDPGVARAIEERAKALGYEALIDPPYRSRGARVTLFPLEDRDGG